MIASNAHIEWGTCSRGAIRATLAAVLVMAGAGSVKDATALNETRTLSFYHTHSGEEITVTFKREGRYDEAALKKLNHFLRDWRSQDSTNMDRRLFDIVWEVYRDVGAAKPVNIISAYRSPQTNAMLRRRSSGVARHSQHMLGHAMDFFIPGVALSDIRAAGLRLQRGGVGFYPTSGSPFVHLDTGSIRHWPRMTPDQLARVFPDGKTVHLPTTGTPLRGYQLAMAEIQNRKGGDGSSSGSGRSFLASLFGSKSSASEDEEEAPAAKTAPSLTPKQVASVSVKPAEAVPLPRLRPARFQVASADSKAVPAPRGREQAGDRPQTIAEIINSRGFWGDDRQPEAKQATPEQIARFRERFAFADASQTGDIKPWTGEEKRETVALAYAAPAAERPADRKVFTASAPVLRSLRPQPPAQDPLAGVNTVVAKGIQPPPLRMAKVSIRKGLERGHNPWLRAMILAPDTYRFMASAAFGDTDLTLMRAHFVKPQTTLAMSFSAAPMQGLICERFTGASSVMLSTTSFRMRTAQLR